MARMYRVVKLLKFFRPKKVGVESLAVIRELCELLDYIEPREGMCLHRGVADEIRRRLSERDEFIGWGAIHGHQR